MTSDRSKRLRLMADDLTGALDTAAELVPLTGPVRVGWRNVDDGAGAFAYDTANREIARSAACQKAARLATTLDLDHAEIAYFKLDSLLRGHAGHELAAVIGTTAFDAVIIAPAFPFQNRHTVGGRQMAFVDGCWRAVGEDIAATLERLGLRVRRAGSDAVIGAGISIHDAANDDDLGRLVAAGHAFAGRILWCGSGGLAAAMAAGTPPLPVPSPAAPLLGLFGTDHPVTVGQLSAANAERLGSNRTSTVTMLMDRLRAGKSVLASIDLPEMPREAAKAAISDYLGEIVRSLPAPASLVCGGGETLRGVCDALAVDSLEVIGRLMPGVPVSRLIGGRWHGCLTVSKSGAFGDRDVLARLVRAADAAGAAGPTAKEPVQ